MKVNELLKELRQKHNLTQEQMAEKLLISRQAISRWEVGETEPNVETLKLISKTFNISINTLLGTPRVLICQVCGMPLQEDEFIGKDNHGYFEEKYCKWCFVDGKHQYDHNNFDELIEVCMNNILHMNPESDEKQLRLMLKENLVNLEYWQEKNAQVD
jgi:transcriptional regulator with XRE-family HTH domain